MRIKNLSAIFTVFIWTTVILAKTVSAEGNDANKVQELAVKSGYQKQVERLPNLMNTLFEARLKGPNIKPERAAKVREILSQAFNVQEMNNTFRQDIDKGLSPQELDAVLAWFNSPIGAKFAQLEESASSSVDLRKQMTAIKAQIAQNAFSTRIEIFHQLDKAALISESRLQKKIEVLKLMSKFSDLMVTGLPLLDEEGMANLIKEKKPLLESSSNEEALHQSLAIYQTVSDNELLQYVSFYQTPAGQKFAAVATKSLLKVFSSSLNTLGDTLVKELTKPNAP